MSWLEILYLKKKINIERGTILERLLTMNLTQAHIHDLNQQLLFQGTYASRSIAGSKETVLGISREDLFNF